MTISLPEGCRWVDAPPPLFRSKTLSFASEAPLICSPNRALTLGAEGSSLYGALALSQSDSKDGRRCPVVMPVTMPLVRPPCVATLARPPPPRENMSCNYSVSVDESPLSSTRTVYPSKGYPHLP